MAPGGSAFPSPPDPIGLEVPFTDRGTAAKGDDDMSKWTWQDSWVAIPATAALVAYGCATGGANFDDEGTGGSSSGTGGSTSSSGGGVDRKSVV